MYSAKKVVIPASCIILFLFAAACADTALVNPSFELSTSSRYGDFSAPKDWNCIHYAEVVSSFDPEDYPPEPGYGSYKYWKVNQLEPVRGEYFVLLSTGNLEEQFSLSQITQQVELKAGERLSFYYFLGTYDYTPYSDYAKVELIGEGDSRNIEVLTTGVDMVGDYSSTDGWCYAQKKFNAENAGVYTLRIMVTDTKDTIYNTYFALDNIEICPSEDMGNLNNDCVVNLLDFAILAQYWLTDCSGLTWCDHRYGIVDYEELANMSQNWLVGDYSCLCPTVREGNFNGDCKVDFCDVADLCRNWLKDCNDVEWCTDGVIDSAYLNRVGDNWLAGHLLE